MGGIGQENTALRGKRIAAARLAQRALPRGAEGDLEHSLLHARRVAGEREEGAVVRGAEERGQRRLRWWWWGGGQERRRASSAAAPPAAQRRAHQGAGAPGAGRCDVRVCPEGGGGLNGLDAGEGDGEAALGGAVEEGGEAGLVRGAVEGWGQREEGEARGEGACRR